MYLSDETLFLNRRLVGFRGRFANIQQDLAYGCLGSFSGGNFRRFLRTSPQKWAWESSPKWSDNSRIKFCQINSFEFPFKDALFLGDIHVVIRSMFLRAKIYTKSCPKKTPNKPGQVHCVSRFCCNLDVVSRFTWKNIWVFPEMVGFPNKPMGFPTKNAHFEVWNGGTTI